MVAKTRAQMMEETRAKLIQAGRKAFAVKGYAAASMDDLTADVGLTRGALYHNFGDKKGLLQAVIDQIDGEMGERLRIERDRAETTWLGLLAEYTAYIEMALEPEIQRIMLLDGPAVLGDPSQWPSQNACLRTTTQTIQALIDEGTVKPVDAELPRACSTARRLALLSGSPPWKTRTAFSPRSSRPFAILRVAC